MGEMEQMMAQVRSVRRPFVSTRRGRANDAHWRKEQEAQPASASAPAPVSTPDSSGAPDIITINLPPLPEAVEGDSTEHEHPGTGEQMQAVEAAPNGAETELTVTEVEADQQAAEARAQLASAEQSSVDTSYSSWTVTTLVAELKRRELPSSGAKPELVARLEESDARQGAQA